MYILYIIIVCCARSRDLFDEVQVTITRCGVTQCTHDECPARCVGMGTAMGVDDEHIMMLIMIIYIQYNSCIYTSACMCDSLSKLYDYWADDDDGKRMRCEMITQISSSTAARHTIV